jgi:tRNA threonylcarbamoyladenosine biosynthesis protein TsaE
MHIKVSCANLEETQNLAQNLAQIAKKGDTFLLFGTLGVGKSVFARAFVQHLTKAKEVPSPTFTLVQTYEAPEFEIYHFDLYRLKDPEEIWELNIEDALYSAVSLIEWPEKMGPYIPADAFKVSITPLSNTGRLFKIETNSADKQARLENLPFLKEA